MPTFRQNKRCPYLDLSKHVFTHTHIPKTGCMTTNIDIFKFEKINTVTEGMTFINAEGIMSVTGDWGNWVFCRMFFPSASGHVSDSYWCEKLMNASKQDSHTHDNDIAIKEIDELLNDPDNEWSEEEKEFWEELKGTAGSEYEWIAVAMNRPRSIDAEQIPKGKILDCWLAVIFDGFDEICRRMEAGEIPEISCEE